MHWIPAYAGMTLYWCGDIHDGAGSLPLVRLAEGRQRWGVVCLALRATQPAPRPSRAEALLGRACRARGDALARAAQQARLLQPSQDPLSPAIAALGERS